MDLKPEDTVYRAIVNAEDNIRVLTSTVNSVGKRITLEGNRLRRVFPLEAFGRLFFATREGALQRLRFDLERELATAERTIKFTTAVLAKLDAINPQGDQT